MKNKVPGTPLRGAEEGEYAWYLLGGDNLARDVFSRVIKGAWVVVQIAPLATLFAFMVGITLGLPAGYYGGRLDTILSLPCQPDPGLPGDPAVLPAGDAGDRRDRHSQLHGDGAVRLPDRLRRHPAELALSHPAEDPHAAADRRAGRDDLALPVADLVQAAARSTSCPRWLDGFDMPGGILVVFVSVVFVNSPTVFRIVRGLALDIKTRDYVAAAQTRGEGPWYIMLWEILPNARGPLIVDFCLRIGYTTILLGTLGFFGLGLPPESPDWGSTINEGRKLLSIYLHPALPPALALLSLVLGLNLLADGLREESLKD